MPITPTRRTPTASALGGWRSAAEREAFTVRPSVSTPTMRAASRVRDRLGDVSAQLQENLAGQLVIKAFAQEDEAMSGFRETNADYLHEQDRAINARTVFLPSVQFIGFLSSVIMIGLGAWFVVRGTFTIGGLVAYRGYWWQLYSPVDTLATVNELLQRAVAAVASDIDCGDAGRAGIYEIAVGIIERHRAGGAVAAPYAEADAVVRARDEPGRIRLHGEG